MARRASNNCMSLARRLQKIAGGPAGQCLLWRPASDMPDSFIAWLCVKMYTSVEQDFSPTCYERPPVLRDRFCWIEGVVAQDRFYWVITVSASVECTKSKRELYKWPCTRVHLADLIVDHRTAKYRPYYIRPPCTGQMLSALLQSELKLAE